MVTLSGDKRQVSAKQRVYHHLQKQISSGVVAGGSIISELQISRDLKVSRSPVREAIGQLIAEGLLAQAPNRSSVVIDLSRTDIIDLYEVREALETFAVRKVAERGLPPSSLEQLESVLQRFQHLIDSLQDHPKAVLDSAQQAEFMNLDLRLHGLLVLSTQNTRMQKIIHDTRVLVRIFSIRKHGQDLVALKRIHGQHQEIVNAVASGDGSLASQLLSQHIHASMQERLDEFDRWTREKLMLVHETSLISDAALHDL
jgi:DNA-binding GntR family transcriptional regulator